MEIARARRYAPAAKRCQTSWDLEIESHVIRSGKSPGDSSTIRHRADGNDLSRRKRIGWIKKTFIVLTLLLIVCTVSAAYMLRRAPSFYARPNLTDEQRSTLAREAQNQLIRAREFANSARVAEAQSATNPAAATRPGSMVVDFSQDQVNSLIDRWGEMGDWRAGYQKYIEEPVIIFQKDRIILAGLSKDLGTVVSLHFATNIDAEGNLNLTLERVLGGNLPMPESMYARYRDKLARGLATKLVSWQRRAALRPDGTVNDDAVVAGMAKMLLGGLTRQAADPYIFLPNAPTGPGAVPMRIMKFDVQKGQASLTIHSLNTAERAAMIEQLKRPLTPSVSTAQ
jgi:hypothetical protein